MKRLLVLLLSLTLVTFVGKSQTKVVKLLTENLVDPIGMDVQQPRFSWQLESDKRNLKQTGYEIRLSKGSLGKGDENLTWSTKKVDSDSSVHVTYKGNPLQPNSR